METELHIDTLDCQLTDSWFCHRTEHIYIIWWLYLWVVIELTISRYMDKSLPSIYKALTRIIDIIKRICKVNETCKDITTLLSVIFDILFNYTNRDYVMSTGCYWWHESFRAVFNEYRLGHKLDTVLNTSDIYIQQITNHVIYLYNLIVLLTVI